MLRERCGRMLAFVSFLSLSVPGLSAVAQDAAPAKPKAVPSSGLSGSINDIATPNNHMIVFQVALQNVSKNRIYILFYGSNKASTDLGVVGVVNITDVVGANHCFSFNGEDDSYSYKKCFEQNGPDGSKAKDIDQYSYIEPNDTIIVSVPYSFGPDISQAHFVNFSFDAIVRNATSDADLPGASPDKTVGPAHPLNLNFPLLPLKKD